MPNPSRDRSLPVTLPVIRRRESRYCAFCGSLVPANAERYGKYAYCNSQCHKSGRRANAAENRKRKRLRAAMPTVTPPTEQKCWRCNRRVADNPDAFANDMSRVSGKANICRTCEREKTAAYYQRNSERIKRKSKVRNRQSRDANYPVVPDGIDLTARQLARVTTNLQEILAVLPTDAPAVLLNALSAGKINGAVFEDCGGCGCLWGTLGRAYSWSIAEEGEYARKFRQRYCAEIDLFGHIAPGDTIGNNPYADIAAQTILQFLDRP